MLWQALDHRIAMIWCTYVPQWVSAKLQFTSRSLLLIHLEDVVSVSIRQWCAENEVNFASNQTVSSRGRQMEMLTCPEAG